MRARICPPRTRLAPLSDDERRAQIDRSPLFGKYEDATDRVSAYEQLAQARAEPADGLGGALETVLGGGTRSNRGRGRPQKSVGEQVAGAIVRSVASSVGRQIGTAIVRGVLGSILKR
jgi:hypothetical protein